ncbi:ribbon-helix-helix domain-containing protein [Sphingomonas sp.]|uniref:ribbon-helix-helix domain-containing protein n=1 Tax=Sphingomonas sp. TaxID=28214 RepID=UPI00286D8151|nr:ribbon-helix-helix domain-containing protein [Sphingomonas sp.]
MTDEAPAFGTPIKRSVTIAGHETSISLEPAFWAALEHAAAARNLPVNALIAEIDAARLEASRVPNLTSALRQWLLASARESR